MSVDDVVAAQQGQRPLPPKAVLLTFDDGYRSFYTHVYPLLRAFDYPAVLSVVGSFLDVPPGHRSVTATDLVAREDFVSWEQLREMRRSGLVEIGSHTYGFHSTVFTNPQGGEAPAAIGHGFIRRRPGLRISERVPLEMPQPRFGDLRSILTFRFRPYLSLAIELAQAAIDYAYDPRTGRYETDAEYGRRVRADLERNSDLLAAQLGVRPRVITWPYGRWNEVTVAAAREAGMPISLTLDPERASIGDLRRIGRFYAVENPGLRFVSDVLTHPPEPALLRGLCVNPDEVFASSEEEQDIRLGQILDRILAFRPNMVLLAAASSAPGGGVVLLDRPVAGPGGSLQPSGVADLQRGQARTCLPGCRPSRRAVMQTRPSPSTARWRVRCPSVASSLGPNLSERPTWRRRRWAPGVSRWDPRTPRRVRRGAGADAPVRARARARCACSTPWPATSRAVKVLDVADLSRAPPSRRRWPRTLSTTSRCVGRGGRRKRSGSLKEPGLARGRQLGPARVLEQSERAGGMASRTGMPVS